MASAASQGVDTGSQRKCRDDMTAGDQGTALRSGTTLGFPGFGPRTEVASAASQGMDPGSERKCGGDKTAGDQGIGPRSRTTLGFPCPGLRTEMASAASQGVDPESERKSVGDVTAGDHGTAPSTSLNGEGVSRPSPGTSKLRLLLLGKHGAGKSATGNTILGRAVFKSRFSGSMVTTECQRESGTVGGREVEVIDTPDLFSSLAPAEGRQLSLQHCSELSAGGLHALLLVIPFGHCTVQDKETIEGIRAAFGAEAMSRMVVVFTRKDELGEDSLQEFIESNESLKTLAGEVGGRCCAFSNKGDEGQRDLQVSQLLDMVQCLVEESPGPYCVGLSMEDISFGAHGNKVTCQEEDGACGLKERQLYIPESEQNPETQELRIFLMGKRGVGKSTAGNTILGKQVFRVQFSETRVTNTCKSESRTWRRWRVLVTDSPDISWYAEKKLKEPPFQVPHAFLLVIPLGSSIKRDDKMFKTIQKFFGEKFTKYTVILFTRKEDFVAWDIDTLKSKNIVPLDLTQSCEERYSVFNYLATEEEKRIQVDHLLEQVERMVQKNGGRPCVLREKEPLSIVLVGRSGTGKSASGNTILGRPVFLSQLRAQPVTETCQSDSRTVKGQEVVVVDTPSFSQVHGGERERSWLEKELSRCWTLCAEGAKIFVLVVQLGRFTQEDQAEVRQLEAIFGENVLKYMIVLFTRKEDLEDGSLEKYTKDTDNTALKNVLKKCGGGVCAFNNNETGRGQERQVEDLLKKANELREKYGWCGYPCSWENVSHPKGNSSSHKFLGNVKGMINQTVEKLGTLSNPFKFG